MRFSYLGPNLRYFRLRRHLTQEDLARRAAATLRGRGFSQTYISRLERGMKPASAEHVDRAGRSPEGFRTDAPRAAANCARCGGPPRHHRHRGRSHTGAR